METFINLTNQSQGRDRIFRTTQYACAFLKYVLRNNASKKELVKKLQGIESHLSSGRKLFRLGNTVNSIDAAKRTVCLSDPVLRFCLTVANLNRALYFICDNVLWARSIGFIGDVNKERWRSNASRYYFYSLIMNLTRDLYAIARIMIQKSQERRHQHKMNRDTCNGGEEACGGERDLHSFLSLLYESLKSSPPLVLDTVKNVWDLFIPLDRLGIYRTNAGVIGFCGLMSSLVGMLMLLKPSLKLKP